MASRNDMRHLNQLVEIIKQSGTIGKVRLVMQSGMSVSMYDKLKPFLEEVYQHQVRYDRELKQWIYCAVEELEIAPEKKTLTD